MNKAGTSLSFIFLLRGHLGCFHLLVIVTNASMNIGVHSPFQISVPVFFEYVSSSEIAELYGNSNFSFLRKLYVALHNGCTSLWIYSHQQYIRIPFSSHSC